MLDFSVIESKLFKLDIFLKQKPKKKTFNLYLVSALLHEIPFYKIGFDRLPLWKASCENLYLSFDVKNRFCCQWDDHAHY